MDKNASCGTWAKFGPYLRSNKQQGALARRTKAQVAFFFIEVFRFQREAEFQNCETNSQRFLKIKKFDGNVKQRVENPSCIKWQFKKS